MQSGNVPLRRRRPRIKSGLRNYYFVGIVGTLEAAGAVTALAAGDVPVGICAGPLATGAVAGARSSTLPVPLVGRARSFDK
jgi:hypothetical protein